MPARRFAAIVAALAAVLLATAQLAAQTKPGSADELAGLWKAQRSFGPFARGPLVIQRVGSSYTADMLGRTIAVRVDAGELSFALPDGQGTFRGKLHARDISGYWLPPNSPTGFQRASPVVLRAENSARWSGVVVPADDIFTFYILAQKRPDGSMGVFLRNPQRDQGAFWGADRLVRDGNVVKLVAKRRGQSEESELAAGVYNADDTVLTLVFPGRGPS